MSEIRTQSYPRQPRVGDTIEIHVGAVVVEAVHDHGRQLDVRDRLGRVWHPVRADTGRWTRLAPSPRP